MAGLFVNADWSALVPAGSAEAAFGITEKDALRRGLLPAVEGVEPEEEPEVMRSANLLEAASDAKEAPPPADKEAAKPDDKAIKKPRTK